MLRLSWEQTREKVWTKRLRPVNREVESFWAAVHPASAAVAWMAAISESSVFVAFSS